MFDNIKILSEGLNASFKVTIYLPDDYDKTDKTYKALYIVGGSNPFLIPTYSLEEILKQKNVIGISIYPNLEIKRIIYFLMSLMINLDLLKFMRSSLSTKLNP